jgi:hypothetical protein
MAWFQSQRGRRLFGRLSEQPKPQAPFGKVQPRADTSRRKLGTLEEVGVIECRAVKGDIRRREPDFGIRREQDTVPVAEMRDSATKQVAIAE